MTHSAVPTQISTQRISHIFDEIGVPYFTDSFGELGTLTEDRLYQFFLTGSDNEILVIRGRWIRTASIERANEILELCNKWNAVTIWPKAYYRVRDDGRINIITEVSYDLEFGVTSQQLESIIHGTLQTSSQFFDELERVFPDPLKAD